MVLEIRPKLDSVRQKRSDAIAEQIKDYIFRMELKPGERLPQEGRLIEMFESARSTVREALRSLEVQGVIQNSTGPTGGARVAAVSLQRSIDLLSNYFYFEPVSSLQIYQVRKIIEPELAGTVASVLTEDHLAQLERTISLQHELSGSAKNWERLRHIEMDFHDILVEACDNPILALAARFINSAIRSTIRRAHLDENAQSFTDDNIAFHQKLLEAFRARDGGAAREIMREHVISAEPYVLTVDERIDVRDVRHVIRQSRG